MNFDEWHLAQIAEGFPWARDRAVAEEVWRSLAPPPQEQTALAETIRLRTEVSQLRRQIGALEGRLQYRGHALTAGALVTAIGDVLGQVRGSVDARIEKLERRVPIAYRGLWNEDEQYAVGDIVSWGGTAWYCKSVNSGQKPAMTSPDFWNVFVKRGRDGKDAKPLEPTVR